MNAPAIGVLDGVLHAVCDSAMEDPALKELLLQPIQNPFWQIANPGYFGYLYSIRARDAAIDVAAAGAVRAFERGDRGQREVIGELVSAVERYAAALSRRGD